MLNAYRGMVILLYDDPGGIQTRVSCLKMRGKNHPGIMVIIGKLPKQLICSRYYIRCQKNNNPVEDREFSLDCTGHPFSGTMENRFFHDIVFDNGSDATYNI